MDRRIEAAIEAARSAGEIALRHFRTELEVESKPDGSPVTVADRECEQRIVEILGARFPDYGFFGEELGEQGSRDGPRWIIDPIDGTKSFVRRIPFFATLIGLEEEGEVVAGVIHAPATGELLRAVRGGGAFDEIGDSPAGVGNRSTFPLDGELRRNGDFPAARLLEVTRIDRGGVGPATRLRRLPRELDGGSGLVRSNARARRQGLGSGAPSGDSRGGGRALSPTSRETGRFMAAPPWSPTDASTTRSSNSCRATGGSAIPVEGAGAAAGPAGQ